jgi:Rrf2 family protein
LRADGEHAGSATDTGRLPAVRITAKADYAVRAAAELASAYGQERPVKGETIATNQGIPQKFLENILSDLRQAGLVKSQRGVDGGYRLAKAPADVSVADVIRAVEGPLASVRGEAPEDVEYGGAAQPLQDVWIAVRASLRTVVEHVTLADLATGKVPAKIARLADDPDARLRR